MGQPIADFANRLFADDSYQDYLEVHGIGVQLTEAFAEYWHQRVRSELKFGDTAMSDEGSGLGAGLLRSEVPRRPLLLRLRRLHPELEDRAKMMELLEPEPRRRDPERGTGCIRSSRPMPSCCCRGQVLQRLAPGARAGARTRWSRARPSPIPSPSTIRAGTGVE